MEEKLELSTDGLKAVKSDAGYTLALTVAEKDYSKFDETVKAWDKDHERTTKDTFTLTYVYDKESGTWVNNDEIVINYACKNGGGQTGDCLLYTSVNVPLFINQGEKIKIDTRTGEYLGRVNN